MEDLEFSGFNQNVVLPTVVEPIIPPDSVALRNGIVGADEKSVIVPQGKDVQKNEEITCEPIGQLLQDQKSTGLQMMDSMSENWSSLLQCLKVGTITNIRQTPFTGERTVTFSPSAWSVSTRNGVTGVFERRNGIANVLMNIIKSCYAYQRGGYEVSVLPAHDGPETNFNPYIALNEEGGPSIRIGPAPGVFGCVSNDTFDFGRIRNVRAANHGRFGLSAVVPYKSRYRVNVIYPYTTPNALNNGDGDPLLELSDQTRVTLTYTANSSIHVRPAEDFQLLYWVGVPAFLFAV
jgi:hypothetical protein